VEGCGGLFLLFPILKITQHIAFTTSTTSTPFTLFKEKY
jgi:hypothetical protein